LFQAWEHLWPVSSESVKEQLSAILADKTSPSLADLLFASNGVMGFPRFGGQEVKQRSPLVVDRKVARTHPG
jgi:hypothetical protein